MSRCDGHRPGPLLAIDEDEPTASTALARGIVDSKAFPMIEQWSSAPAQHPGSEPRGTVPFGGILRLGPVSLDFNCYAAYVDGGALRLTRMEFNMLAHLMRCAPRVVSQEELMQQVVGGTFAANSSLIRVHMSHLRRKLGQCATAIATVRSRGFQFRDDAGDGSAVDGG